MTSAINKGTRLIAELVENLDENSSMNQMVLNQHVFPIRSISRFYSHKNTVDLLDKRRHKRRPAAGKDNIFVAKRVWDQYTETVGMRELEDKFQAIAISVIENPDRPLNKQDSAAVTSFYGLWIARSVARTAPLCDPLIECLTVERRELSQIEQDQLEASGLIYYGPDGFSDQQMKGSMIKDLISFWRRHLRGRVWSPLRAEAGEIVVPDATSHAWIPLTPTIFLMPTEVGREMFCVDVTQLNVRSVTEAKEYYFAHDLNKCVGISDIMVVHQLPPIEPLIA